MNEMIGHIFGDLENHEKSIKYLQKALREQVRCNKRQTTLVIATMVYLVSMQIRIADQNTKINILNKKLEELKEQKED